MAHGYAALLLGDPTAKNEGRLTFNLLPHIDPLGTIIVPAILLLTNAGILFGWAKPVPYNPYNLKGKYSEAIVAAAGSAVNILIAVVFGLLYRFGIGILPEPILSLSAGIMYINLFLGLFNLIPIPPLDGSRIVLSLLPGACAHETGTTTHLIHQRKRHYYADSGVAGIVLICN